MEKKTQVISIENTGQVSFERRGMQTPRSLVVPQSFKFALATRVSLLKFDALSMDTNKLHT